PDGRIRVLWLVKGLGRGGAERLIVAMAPKLDPVRFTVEVAYLLPWKDDVVAELEAAGIGVHCLRARCTLDAGWVARLRELLRDGSYDVVHTHSPAPAAVARLIAPRRTRIVHTEHNVWDAYRAPTRLANAFTYARNDTVWAVSDGVRATIRPPRVLRLLGRARPPVTTMHHGVEVAGVARGPEARAAARASLGLADDAPVVGTVANLTAKKDPATLIAAIDLVRARLPDVRLVLIGSGPLEATLRDEIADRGLGEHVRLLGTRDDVPALLPAFDVFALSSRFEGLGLSLLEAMAAEVACVSTAVGGVPEVITDGDNGRLVPVADPAALADAIVQVLTDDHARAAMVAAGRERVRAGFASVDHVVRASEELYERLTGSTTSG
ncbi:MAG: glycosyltransferase, partial [Dehalococcoidia bacterium]